MAFKDISGNSHVKKILTLALERKRVPNSLLFWGQDGVGKKRTALTLAKALNCRRKTNDACDDCDHCRAIEDRRFPDVIEIAPEKNVLKIDQIKFIKQIAYLRPLTGEKKVFLVLEAEKMNEDAGNALLKILEEPPLSSHIILITRNLYLILPTIQSRCQILGFSPIRKEETEVILREKGYAEEQAKLISILAEGNLEQALGLEWEAVQAQRKEAWDFLLSLLQGRDSSSFLRRFAYSQRWVVGEDLIQTLKMFSSFFRDFILIKERGDARYLLNPDFESDLRSAEGHISRDQAMDHLRRIDEALLAIPRNMNINLVASSIFSDIGDLRNG
ncbi:MAG: DNA polymerase III subunit delta' [Acidobacteriota bacterium]|nr:DNA polymerase III subunit delta' [Acidobacteriota bacterium]